MKTFQVPGRKPVLALLMRLLWATALVLPAFGAQAGVVLTTLHSFQQPFPNGAIPHAGLVQGSDGNFYGTTTAGGTNGNGTVFQLSANGALTCLYSFTGGNDGSDPEARLVQDNDGNFYGTTRDGGTNGDGTVFRISPTGALTSLHSFNFYDGDYPSAALVQGRDGNFYGTSIDGGINSSGAVFKITTNGALTTLHLFTGGNDGRTPDAGLIQGRDGNFYGATIEGGAYNYGTVFKISASGTLTTLYSFTGGADGYSPGAALVQGSDGNFYGISEGGLGAGTVFKISTNGALTTLYAITWGPYYLSGGLIQGSDGNLYGTTAYNNGGNPGSGTEGSGTVFQISTNGALISLYFFPGSTEGANPEAGLVQGSDGNFYGTTDDGGPDNYGTVFKITTNGALSTLYSFTGGVDGANPEAGLVQGRDGNFYGATIEGGAGIGLSGFGTVFQISTNGTYTSLYSFTGGNDGANPEAGLVQGSDGNFYGTTASGGTNFDGTVFKITTNGALTSLYSFGSVLVLEWDPYGYSYQIALDGAGPNGLVQGSDGSFYGTTEYGGTNDNGTVFKISTNGALTTLYSFGMRTNANGQQIPPPDGANPEAGLVQGSDGNFYGTTATTVFQMTPAGVLTTLNSDVGSSSALVQGSDGCFYGTTQYGGTVTNQYGAGNGGYGTVFRISTNGALTYLHLFTGGNDGANPYAGLVQGRDGSFYGTTDSVFGVGVGTVFRLTIVPEFQQVTLSNNTLSLTWSTEAGGTYQLQYTSELSSGNWSNLGSAITATGATLNTTDSLTNGPQRFYRLALLP